MFVFITFGQSNAYRLPCLTNGWVLGVGTHSRPGRIWRFQPTDVATIHCVLRTLSKPIMSLYFKPNRSYVKINILIWPQFPICHDTWSAVMCAKLWNYCVPKIKFRAKRVFTSFHLWLETPDVKWVPVFSLESLKTQDRQFDNFVVTGVTVRIHQWRQSCQWYPTENWNFDCTLFEFLYPIISVNHLHY